MRKGNAASTEDHRENESNSEVTLLRDRTEKIRTLRGFQKTHRIPDQADDQSNAFIARIATDDIAAHLNEVHSAMRQCFRFKRREMIASEIIEGSASISTPAFRYEVSVSVDVDDPTCIMWHHRMTDIVDQHSILETQFNDVFGEMFNTIEFSAPCGIDIETLIDSVEDLEFSGVELDYPHDASSCTIQFSGRDVDLYFERSGMRLVHRHARPPAEILQVYFELQASLGSGIDLPTLDSSN